MDQTRAARARSAPRPREARLIQTISGLHGKVADELEVAANRGQQREVWQKIKILSKRRTNTCKAIKDLSGKPIAEPAAQRLRWQKHFSDLLNFIHLAMN